MKIRDLSEKGVLFVAQIRGKGGCFLTLEHEYVPFFGVQGGGAGGKTYLRCCPSLDCPKSRKISYGWES